MLQSIMMGCVGGQRAMTPIATVAVAAARGELRHDGTAARLLGHPLVAAGAVALAAAEMAGDKMKSAPDRIVPIGLAARFVTSAIAGAALAPPRQRPAAALAAGLVSLGASWLGWRARMAAMRRHDRVTTGALEDALVLGSATAVMRMA
ncbi:DUF4126 domain-containing protein [Erythrobacter sp. WG]|uniref:DUF4126 domain-containing protein n=1 Tax=Erythrobacter sp. WG TaxID=2985510 RepID=UPI00226DED3D|nr:DUF4126 domain-containing protein [Erythrobacter sp. WG]MCX9148408.1 DUF4126 domain-containing protein [Erythrobacter sp. WG]